MTNKELIKEIVAVSDYSENDLKNLKKIELEEILNDLNQAYFGDEEIEEVDDNIYIDINKLSKADQRLYAKTGKISQSVINKYTRFFESEDQDEDTEE